MNLTTVTVSGVDDKINIGDIIELSKKYPFVEWAILLNPKRINSPRYPSLTWMREVIKHKRDLRLAIHVCGEWVRRIVRDGEWFWETEPAMLPIWRGARRVQINLRSEEKMSMKAMLELREKSNNIAGDIDLGNKKFILQVDGPGNWILQKTLDHGISVFPLFDKSGGNGQLPEVWPISLKNTTSGYAGGLTPDNVVEQIVKISETIPHRANIWIDAESGLRTNEAMDLSKVNKYLENTSRLVSKTANVVAMMESDMNRKKLLKMDSEQ